MKLIFAQGNSGRQYVRTRHNTGFLFADKLARKWGAEFVHKPKFQAAIAETSLHDEKIIIVKPTTFYNDTGQSARSLVDFYKLNPATDVLVVHDELALPFGTVRTRDQGSDAGNNGIKSLNSHIGEHYKRIRIGIHAPLAEHMPSTDFVLSQFSAEERELLPQIFTLAEKLATSFVADDFYLTKVKI